MRLIEITFLVLLLSACSHTAVKIPDFPTPPPELMEAPVQLKKL